MLSEMWGLEEETSAQQTPVHSRCGNTGKIQTPQWKWEEQLKHEPSKHAVLGSTPSTTAEKGKVLSCPVDHVGLIVLITLHVCNVCWCIWRSEDNYVDLVFLFYLGEF